MPKFTCREAEAIVDVQGDVMRCIPTDYDSYPELDKGAADDIVAVHERLAGQFGSTRAAVLLGEVVGRAISLKVEAEGIGLGDDQRW